MSHLAFIFRSFPSCLILDASYWTLTLQLQYNGNLGDTVLFPLGQTNCGMELACTCHVMLHTSLSWCCTTRQNTKGFCWVYADLDVFSSGKYFFFLHPLWFFPNILTCFLLSQPSHFLPPVHTTQLCKVLEVAIVYVHFWKEAQRKPTVSTNHAFILRLLLTALITELRQFASYPHDISPCCYAWWNHSPWPLCFWKICQNSASTSK